MNTLIAAAVGLLVGAHIATWGMFKDAPHEGFTWLRFFRSILIGGLVAPLLTHGLNLDIAQPGNLLLLFGLAYVAERAATEFWKTFLRDEDQSKYFIPMQFTIRGRPVHRHARLAFGLAAIALAVVMLGLANGLLRADAGLSRPLVYLALGSLGGWYSAFGGAWKDALFEGFQWLKFFRSPVLAAMYALLIAPFSRSPILVAFAALGFTIATLETWKTFCFPSKPRGKFAGKPVLFPAMLAFRRSFVPLYAAIWAGIIVAFAWSYWTAP